MLYFPSRIVSAVSAFLYPGYASYKTLSQRPCSQEELEHWLMYWTVLGCLVSVEYVAEWLVSWFPFYYPVKTIFLLFLALPQTRGSTYLYHAYVEPFFHEHEASIDSGIAQLKNRVYTYLTDKFRILWEQVAASVGNQPPPQSLQSPSGAAGAPPSMANPVSAPVQMLSNLWTAYGPLVVASGTALLRQTQQSAAAASTDPALVSPVPTPPRNSRIDSSQSVLERKRQLEAELAALSAHESDVSSVPMSRHSSDSDMRGRTHSRTGFEEIKVPSDVEGYDSGDGFPTRPPATTSGGSWFGWGATPQKSGYEKVKDE